MASNRSATRRLRLNQCWIQQQAEAAAIAADTPEPKAEAAALAQLVA